MSILINDGVKISKTNTPTREGERIASLSQMGTIPTPYVGMRVFVEGSGKEYVITSLKEKETAGEVIPNAVIDTYVELAYQKSVDELQSTLEDVEGSLADAITAEEQRASAAESELQNNIASTRNEAKNDLEAVESNLAQAITEEEERAQAAEQLLRDGATQRFASVEETTKNIVRGEHDITAVEVVYYKPEKIFVAKGKDGNLYGTWNGSNAYMSSRGIRKDKVYICGGALYVWNGTDLVDITADVKQQVSDLIGEAPDTLDSIHEIAAWINNDNTGAAAMATQVAQNKTDIANEAQRAKDVETTLQANITAEVERAKAAEEQLQKDIDTTRFSRITGDGAILATGNSMRGFSPGRIYRFIFDKQVETTATTGYTMFGVVAIDANGKRYSLGDATRVAESVTHAPYYDYAIPNIEGPISIEPSARLEKDLEVTIKAEDITEIKVPYKCEYGTIQIPSGSLIDSEGKIRARVLVPISNGSGLKRILFNAADGIENTGVVYAFKNGEFIERITAIAGRKVVGFYGNSDFDSVLVLFKKTDDSAISASELNSICVYSDIDINNTIACENYRNINIDFERGMLAENGNPYGAISNAERFSGSIQRLFLTWSPCNHIISELPTGCTIYCYNSAFAIIGTTKDKNSIPQNTAYIKLSSELPIYSLTLTVKMQGQVEFVKNGIYANSEYPRYRAISYEMKFPIEGDVEPTLEYQGNDEFVWNNGYIILPHNYDPKGKPVPLIIRCHGTGGYTWGQTELSSTTKDYIFFLAKNGFAVADCSAMTSKYSAQRDCNVPNKISFACYCNLYKYLVDNFNIKTDGVYISGKSAGGMNSAAMGILQPFPIKAVAGLAPSLDFYTNMRFISAASDVNWAFQQLGIPFYAEENSYKPLLTVTEEAKSILMANIDKVAGYSAMGMFNDVDIEHFYERALSDNLFALEEDTELMAIVASAHKIQPAPMKIWHAIDDDAVPISTSRFYRTMVRNAGGVCYLREFPVGCGKHYAVDSGENAPRVDYLCANGETANVPVAYAEMLEWFKQW